MNWDALTEDELREYRALRRSFWVHQHQERDAWPPRINEDVADAFQEGIAAGHIDPETYLLTATGEQRYMHFNQRLAD